MEQDRRHYDNYDRRYYDYDRGNYESDSDSDFDFDFSCWNDNIDCQYEGGVEHNYNEIMYSEYDNNNDEYIHKKYYIGSYWYENNENIVKQYAKTIKISTFYNFTSNCISNYICLLCDLHFLNFIPPIDIIQIIINDDGTNEYIIKTFWIKIIQRKWKRIIQEKRIIL